MKIIISMITIFALVVTVGITVSEAAESSKLYTAYNIWVTSKMRCINFKQGTDIIPAGTEVQNVRLKTKLGSNVAKPPDMREYVIGFTTVRDGRTFTIDFNQRWHPRKTIEDCKDMMFTTKIFESQTEGLSGMEIYAIKKGTLLNGMSKKAVLISYGPPPEHDTPNQNANTWYYWIDKKQKIEITFDKSNKLAVGGEENTPEISKDILAIKEESDTAAKLINQRDFSDKGSGLYTAHNIWKASKMMCINFKEGTDIIPAGTEVRDVGLIYFTTVQDGQKYTIGFKRKWHTYKSREDYKDMMFTTKKILRH